MRSIPRSRRTSSRPGFPAFVGDLRLQPAILIAEPAFPERGGRAFACAHIWGYLRVSMYGYRGARHRRATLSPPPTSTKIAYGNLPLGIDQTACKHRKSQSCHRQSGHCHRQSGHRHSKLSVRWPSHLWFMETLRNMLQNRKRPGAWSVDRPGTRAYHSELRVLWADADAP